MNVHPIGLCYLHRATEPDQQPGVAQNYQKNLKRGMLNDSTLHLWNDG